MPHITTIHIENIATEQDGWDIIDAIEESYPPMGYGTNVQLWCDADTGVYQVKGTRATVCN